MERAGKYSRGVKELSETRIAEIAYDTRWPRLSRLGMARLGTMDEKSPGRDH